MSTQNFTNSNEEEKNYLEEEFLKCEIGEFPSPKKELEDYEDYILEVMKSGCNRQIAEYVILEYIKLEKEDKNNKTLMELRKDYFDLRDPILISTKEAVNENIKNKEIINEIPSQYEENIPVEYEDEIEYVCKNIKKRNEDEDSINYEKNVEYYLKKYIYELNKKEKEIFKEKRRAYTNKRDAVIEACLRKVRKIVNDEEEYKKFYKSYYGKDEPED